MTYSRPPGLLAGFHTGYPDAAVPELQHAGEQWAPRNFPIQRHEHTQWELYLQSSGETIWSAVDRRYRVPAGALFAVPPGVEHALEGVPVHKHHFFFAAIDVEAVLRRLPSMPECWTPRETIFVERAEALTEPFRRLIREVSLPNAYRTAGIRIALDILVLETSRLLVSRSDGQGIPAAFMHPAVIRVREMLDLHPGEAWTVADLAAIAGISPGHLAERFQRDIGTPPHQYLMQRRLDAARELLQATDMPVTEIALELGFSSGQYFATTFRRLSGMSPAAFRRQERRSGRSEEPVRMYGTDSSPGKIP